MPESGRLLVEGFEFSLIRLENEQEFLHEKIQEFDCGNKDLTEFFRKDAFPHHNELLATTYYLQPKRATDENIIHPVALVSFLNDSLRIEESNASISRRKFLKKFKKRVPFKKRGYKSFPAVKIGRLGVVEKYKGNHFGSILLNLTKNFFVTKNKTGCRFLTVDAYNDPDGRTVNFYSKNGFEFLSNEDENEKTRIMWFDLKTFEK